jgi:Uma2 family endonuclease
MMVIQHRLVTVDEFEEFIARDENTDRRFELIDGEIVEKMPTELHGLIAARFAGRMLPFVEDNDLGRVTVEARHRPADDCYNDRIPDVSFTSKARALPVVEKGAVPQMPDLCIEIKSPHDKLLKMREKAMYYLANGARMVWLVIPEKRLIEVYRPDQDVEILTENDTLDGGDIVPGFSLALSYLFK